MRVEGRVVHGGKRSATAEGRVIDGAGKLYAHGTTTCMIFPLGERG
jgi:acyl-coenzyme A thioesterase PaaI-like protein